MVNINANFEKFIYFKIPLQVIFLNPKDSEFHWATGIAYRDEIICSKDGEVIKLEDIYADEEILAYNPKPIELLGDWIDFSEYLIY